MVDETGKRQADAAGPKAPRKTNLHTLAQQHKGRSRQLHDILERAQRDAAFKKRLLEDPERTVRSVFPDADPATIRFISTLESDQFEAAMRNKAEQSDAEASEAEAEG